MNLKAKIKTREAGSSELQMTPIMNVFLILVPFLLLTASFVKLAVLEMSLPSLTQSAGGSVTQASEDNKPLVLNMLAVRQNGLELESPTLTFSLTEKKGDQYDFEQ